MADVAILNINNTDYNIRDEVARSAIPSPADSAPLMDGTAAVGTSLDYAREDHVHPTDTSRQAALVSGTNIKTVNSTSLLGSGNIAVQPTLVSGTNIKTINGTSLLGSGNITISDSDENVKQVNTTDGAQYRVLFSTSAVNTLETSFARKSATLRFDPSTATLTIGSGSEFSSFTGGGISYMFGSTARDYHAIRFIDGGANEFAYAQSRIDMGRNSDITDSESGNYHTFLANDGLRIRYSNTGAPDTATESALFLDNANLYLLTNGTTVDVASEKARLYAGGLALYNSDGSSHRTVTFTTIGNWNNAFWNAGTGLSASGNTINHSNSVSAATTQAVYPIKIDAQGHISDHGSAVTVPTASTIAPLMDGTASYGTGTSYARSNHVHPSDTTRASKDDFQRFTVSNTTTTKTLASGHVYLLVTKRMNNSAAGGIYILAPYEGGTGSVTAVASGAGTTVSMSGNTLTITTSVNNIYCRLIDLNMQS